MRRAACASVFVRAVKVAMCSDVCIRYASCETSNFFSRSSMLLSNVIFITLKSSVFLFLMSSRAAS